jgi:hypothetical protein
MLEASGLISVYCDFINRVPCRSNQTPSASPTFMVASMSIGARAERPLGLHRGARPAAVPAPASAAFCYVVDLAHGFVELLDPKALLFAERINVGHDNGDTLESNAPFGQ